MDPTVNLLGSDYIVRDQHGHTIGSYTEVRIPEGNGLRTFVGFVHDWDSGVKPDMEYRPRLLGAHEDYEEILRFILNEARQNS